MTRSRRETGWVAAAALAALALYVRTLYPGLVGSGDTPELQFVGRVFGIPHTPGYPLYAVLAWLVAHVPLGGLAYRMNLSSAVCGALAVALVARIGMRLGARAPIAVAAALVFGAGVTFWSQATLAEVYALAAALFAAILLALVGWETGRRPAVLLAAIGLTAAAFAHHSSDVVTAAPAFVLFVLLVDRRAALRPAVVGWGALLVASGVAAYGLALLRTRQHAAYLGARADTLAELFETMRGGPFRERLFAFGPAALVTQRVPLVFGILRSELGLAGLALWIVGIVALLRLAPRRALLFGLSALGPLLFALEYDVPDLSVFAIPAFVAAAPVVAAGAELLVAHATGRGVPLAFALVLVGLVPVAQVARSFRACDHHTRTFESRYFGALMDALPAGSVVLPDSYTVEQMLRYEVLGEDYGARKGIVIGKADPDSVAAYVAKGRPVYAFEKARRELAMLGFRFAPLPLDDASLGAVLARAPAGATVAVVGTRIETPAAERDARAALGPFGFAGPLEGRCFAAIGAGSETRGQAVADANAVDLTARIGASTLQASCRSAAASVDLAGKALTRAEDGAAYVVLNAAGQVVERGTTGEVDGLRVPFARRAFPVYRLTGGPDCAAVGNAGVVDVSRVAASGRLLVRIDDREAYDARVELELDAPQPLVPRLTQVEGPGRPELETSDEGAGRTRTTLSVNDRGAFSVMVLDLGGAPRAARVSARVDRDDPRRALVCGVPVGGYFLLAAGEARAALSLGRDGESYLGTGWGELDRAGPLEFRRLSGGEAEILLPLLDARPSGIEVTGMAALPDRGVDILVNGIAFEPQRLSAGWQSVSWDTPADAWRSGLNVVSVRGAPGMAVARVRLGRVGGASSGVMRYPPPP